MTMMTILTHDPLKARAQALQLYGLLSHWEEVAESDWIEPLIQWEEVERARRGLQRRLKEAHLGRFKLLADFNWQWPSQCDRQAVEELMRLAFLEEAANIVLLGPNGVGKSTIARNVAHQAVLAGHTVRFTTAGQMLNELAAQDGDHALRRRIALYARPRLLVIDEVGYLSYSNRHADLLFEIVNRRYEEKSTLITTNSLCGAPHKLFNAAHIVMRTLVPESPGFLLFRTFSTPHNRKGGQGGNKLVSRAEAP